METPVMTTTKGQILVKLTHIHTHLHVNVHSISLRVSQIKLLKVNPQSSM